jgi:hypothetical protein
MFLNFLLMTRSTGLPYPVYRSSRAAWDGGRWTTL